MTPEDRALVESISGFPVTDIDSILETGKRKFVSGREKNKRGHHIIRRILAWRAYEQRLKNFGVWEDPDVQEFVREGIIIKKKIDIKDLPELFGKLMGVPDFESRTFQVLKRESIQHEKNDPQYHLHSDIFYPIAKGWLLTNTVKMEHGPFNYVRQSHGISENRLRWDYDCSQLPPHAIYAGNKATPGKHGSFRVHSSGSPVREAEILKEYGFGGPEPILASVGDAVIANTCGLHKRGRAEQGVIRNAYVAKYRHPKPFYDGS